jgi:hypothetical protein
LVAVEIGTFSMSLLPGDRAGRLHATGTSCC